MRAALAWFDHTGDAISVLRLLSAIDEFWRTRPYHAEVLGWLQPALCATADVRSAVRAGGATPCRQFDQFPRRCLGGHGVRRGGWRSPGNLMTRSSLGRAHWEYGLICAVSGDTARAADRLRRGAATAACGERAVLGRPRARRARRCLAPGWRRHRRSAIARRGGGDSRGFGSARRQRRRLRRAGARRADPGRSSPGAHFFTETIAIAQRTGVERIVLGALAGLAGVALALGQPQRAVRLLGAVEAARESERRRADW